MKDLAECSSELRAALATLEQKIKTVNEVCQEKIDRVHDVSDERDLRYEQRFTAMDEKTSLALNASEKAVTKAEIAQEKRFDNTNEWREAMSDRDRNQMPRIEIEQRFSSMKAQINWAVGVTVTLLIGVSGLVVAIFKLMK